MTAPLQRGLAAAFACLAALLQPAAAPLAAETGVSFVDDFTSFSKKRWAVSHGWANGRHQNCTWSAQQVTTDGGALRLAFVARPTKNRAYACGEIQSRQRFGYGVYEARLKAVRGPGFVTAFFTYIGPTDKQPWHEIDFEVVGKDPARVQLNQFVDGKGGNEAFAPVPGGADRDFHDYAFIWEANRLRYFIDGRLVQTVEDPKQLPSKPMRIIFSLWAGETNPGWLGTFRDPGGQVEAVIERVSYTAPGEPCLYPESLVCRLD
jgi:endo-1,3-1,4-beta-glycanase ExoK